MPKHTKLNEKEVSELLNKYSVSKNNLPKIKMTDPALKGLDVKKGDIIKIERKSFVGITYYYRVVED